MPSPAAPPSGCRFHTRCWLRERLGNPENCETVDPEFRDIGTNHRVACHWAEEIPDTIVKQAVAVDAPAAPPLSIAAAAAAVAAASAPGAAVPAPPEAPQGSWGHGDPAAPDSPPA